MASPSRMKRKHMELMDTCYQPRHEGPKRIPDREVNFNSFFSFAGSRQAAKPAALNNANKKEDKLVNAIENEKKAMRSQQESAQMSGCSKEPAKIRSEKEIKESTATKKHERSTEALPEVIQEESKEDSRFESVVKPQAAVEAAKQRLDSVPKEPATSESKGSKEKRVCYSEILEKEVKRTLQSSKRKRSTDDTARNAEFSSKQGIAADDFPVKESVCIETDPAEILRSVKELHQKVLFAKNLLNDTQSMLASLEAFVKAKREESLASKKSEGLTPDLFFNFIKRVLIPPVTLFSIENGGAEESYILTIGTKEISMIKCDSRVQVQANAVHCRFW